MGLSERVKSIKEPQTIGMARKARELKAQGVNVISLSLGEPDFNTPDVIKWAAKKAIDENYSHYTPVSGYLELRQAIAKKFKRDNNLDYTPEQIVVSTGAKQSIANAMLCLVDPGDEVLVPAPYWVTYIEIVKLAEGKPVIINTTAENNFKISAEQLRNAITPKTKVLIFSSPCNPTGSVYSRDELAAIVKVLEPHKRIFVISDEIYEYINYVGKHVSIAEFPEMKERTIVVNGASKSYAMTGWRVGYIGASKEVAVACDRMQAQFTSATCSISQKAMQAAVEMDMAEVHRMRDEFQRRRDLVYSMLKEIPGIKVNLPEGAFYFFPDVSFYFGATFSLDNQKKGILGKIENSTDFCMYLLDKAHVALVSGDAFGNDNHVRISYTASQEDLKEAMKRIKKALEELRLTKSE
jgi:aspartate aminotransferase